jgi:hypothetical protein
MLSRKENVQRQKRRRYFTSHLCSGLFYVTITYANGAPGSGVELIKTFEAQRMATKVDCPSKSKASTDEFRDWSRISRM